MSIDRRRFMATTAAAGLLPAAAQAADAESEKMTRVFDAIQDASAKSSPERLTSQGLDRRPEFAWARSKLADRSLAGADAERTRMAEAVAALKTINRRRLSGMDLINYDSLHFDRQTQLEGARRFKFGGVGSTNPYVLTRNDAAYRSVPRLLTNQHVVETNDDAEAYLARLDAYAAAIDQDTERFRHDVALGVVPPGFILDRTIEAVTAEASVAPPASPLAATLARKAAGRGLAGDWSGRAQKILEAQVQPALTRQVEALKAAGGRAEVAAHPGVGRFKDGQAYYDWTILSNTTTRMNSREALRMGEAAMKEATARADEILKAQGLTQGTVGARIGALNTDPRFLYPETAEGRARLTERVKALIAAMDAKMPQVFGKFPKTPLEVRPSPPAQEAASPGAYYGGVGEGAARIGIYYINMRLVGASPDWQLPTITFHEANPGHHHQNSLVREARGAGHPILQSLGFTAYSEGWGIYSEQLGEELGLYENDPFGKIGYYRSLLFRATRLVVDSGIHARGWSREQATAFLVDNVGMSERGMINEAERYITQPGQACAYRVGHSQWNAVREQARRRLGAKFDIRKFHDDMLLAGPMPMAVLARRRRLGGQGQGRVD